MSQTKRNFKKEIVEKAFEGGEKAGFLIFLSVAILSLGLLALKKCFPAVHIHPVALGGAFMVTGFATFQCSEVIFKGFEKLCALLEMNPKYGLATVLMGYATRCLANQAGANVEATKTLLENLDCCILVATLIITATPLTLFFAQFCMKKLMKAVDVTKAWYREVF